MKTLILLLTFSCLLPITGKAQQAPRVGEAARTAGDSSKVVNAALEADPALTAKEKRMVLSMREQKGYLLPSHTTEFKATVLSTNFVVPIIRFNKVDGAGATNNQKGNVSFFNSVGAGISINRGSLELTTNDSGEVINRELNSIYGLQVGLLFAANTGSENNANIFAPTLSVSLLNIQIGVGYELGTLPKDDSRTFFTLAYGIPIAKLVKGGFYVLHATQAAGRDAQKNLKGKQQGKQQAIQGFY